MNLTAQLISVEDAAALIAPNDGVWVGGALSIENPFVELLSFKGESLRGLTLVGSTDSRQDDIFNPRYSSAMRIVSIHNLCCSDAASAKKLSESICGLFGINTVALRLSPPDSDGSCRVEAETAELSLAVFGSGSITKRIAMLDLSEPPAATGDTRPKLSVRDFDYICAFSGNAAADSSIA